MSRPISETNNKDKVETINHMFQRNSLQQPNTLEWLKVFKNYELP